MSKDNESTGHRAGRNTSNPPARFRTHSGAKTACGVLSAGERRQTVENRSFSPLFHTKKIDTAFPQDGSGKLRTSFLVNLEKYQGPNRQPERTVKRKRKSFEFLFCIKVNDQKVPNSFCSSYNRAAIRNWHAESPGCIIRLVSYQQKADFCLRKTRFGKSCRKRPRGKLGLFLHH